MDLRLGSILAALLLMVVVVRTPEVNSPFLRKTACFCGKNLTFSFLPSTSHSTES